MNFSKALGGLFRRAFPALSVCAFSKQTTHSFVNASLLEKGVIFRAMGDMLAFCPPLIITDQQVDTVVSALEAAFDEVHASLVG